MITRFYGNLLWFCAVILFMMLSSDTDPLLSMWESLERIAAPPFGSEELCIACACKESAHGGKGEERERETPPKKQAPIFFFFFVGGAVH